MHEFTEVYKHYYQKIIIYKLSKKSQKFITKDNISKSIKYYTI